jgi:hypothetical protein
MNSSTKSAARASIKLGSCCAETAQVPQSLRDVLAVSVQCDCHRATFDWVLQDVYVNRKVL